MKTALMSDTWNQSKYRLIRKLFNNSTLIDCINGEVCSS